MKVLIVEDEPELLKSLEDFASKEGFIHDSATGFQSLEKVLFGRFCLPCQLGLQLELHRILFPGDNAMRFYCLTIRSFALDKVSKSGKNPKHIRSSIKSILRGLFSFLMGPGSTFNQRIKHKSLGINEQLSSNGAH